MVYRSTLGLTRGGGIRRGLFMTTKRPVVGVGAVIFRGDRVLMIQRGNEPGKGNWAIPGGHLEWGERAEDAAVREVLEETGVTCRIRGFVAHVDGTGPVVDGEISYHYVLLDFWGEWESGDVVAADDALQACWLTPDEIDDCKGWPETRRIIREAFELRKAIHIS
jgi:8-oxo-dGTP diphosphatase